MDIANWVIDRIERWCAESGGELIVVRSAGDLDRCLAAGGPVGALLGIQGGHVLEADVRNIGVLRERGVRMFAPAHVMDNDLVGSATGRVAGGLSGFGREVVDELETRGIIVDLAHMSLAGIEQTLPLLTRPFVMSHAALRAEDAGERARRLRRYGAATRNVPAAVAAEIGARGGLFGVVMATQLLGGSQLADGAQTVRRALATAGDANVALGSDMDGALRMLIDVEGLPALADALLNSGVSAEAVTNVLGGNAARFLRSALPA
jgi:microsomal dipeptidase-like Zn-dependent dipeptidase